MGQCISKSDSKCAKLKFGAKLFDCQSSFHEQQLELLLDSVAILNLNGYTVDHLKWTQLHSGSSSNCAHWITWNRTFDLSVCLLSCISSCARVKTMIIRLYTSGMRLWTVGMSMRHTKTVQLVSHSISPMYFIVEFIQRKAHTVQVDGIVCFTLQNLLNLFFPVAFLTLSRGRMHACLPRWNSIRW